MAGDGRAPNIFYSGSAKVTLTDSDDVQIWSKDPVTTGGDSGEFAGDWDAITVYSINSVVDLSGDFYVSITNNNQNNNPSTTATAWTQFDLLKRWNINEEYAAGDPVIASNGLLYTSAIAANTGNDPSLNGLFWVRDIWISTITYRLDEIVVGSDGNRYIAIISSSIGSDPVSTPTAWSQFDLLKRWNVNEEYAAGDPVIASNGLVYTSLAASNTGNDPSLNGLFWVRDIWISTITYKLNGIVVGSDGNTYLSKINGNTGNDPVTDTAGNWTSGTSAGKNVLLGNFRVNQRVVTGTVVLAAGVYGHDRMRGGPAGGTYTFATSANVTTATITAGSIEQEVKGSNIKSGEHTLSWGGTALGSVDGGTPAASPITATLTGGTNAVVEFETGTVFDPQLEPGAIATKFDRLDTGLERLLCYPYYWKTYDYAVAPGTAAAQEGRIVGPSVALNSIAGAHITVQYPVAMQSGSPPIVTAYGTLSGTTARVYDVRSGGEVAGNATVIGQSAANVTNTAANNNAPAIYAVQITVEDEL